MSEIKYSRIIVKSYIRSTTSGSTTKLEFDLYREEPYLPGMDVESPKVYGIIR